MTKKRKPSLYLRRPRMAPGAKFALLLYDTLYVILNNQKELYMTDTRAVKLSSDIVFEAHKYAVVFSRSVPKQIEHWAKIGRIAEENPDLPYNFIKDILVSLEEINSEKPVPYQFG